MQTPSDNASSILVYKALKEVIFQARNLIVKLLHKPDATEALLALEKATLQYSNVFSTAASTPGAGKIMLCVPEEQRTLCLDIQSCCKEILHNLLSNDNNPSLFRDLDALTFTLVSKASILFLWLKESTSPGQHSVDDLIRKTLVLGKTIGLQEEQAERIVANFKNLCAELLLVVLKSTLTDSYSLKLSDLYSVAARYVLNITNGSESNQDFSVFESSFSQLYSGSMALVELLSNEQVFTMLRSNRPSEIISPVQTLAQLAKCDWNFQLLKRSWENFWHCIVELFILDSGYFSLKDALGSFTGTVQHPKFGNLNYMLLDILITGFGIPSSESNAFYDSHNRELTFKLTGLRICLSFKWTFSSQTLSDSGLEHPHVFFKNDLGSGKATSERISINTTLCCTGNAESMEIKLGKVCADIGSVEVEVHGSSGLLAIAYNWILSLFREQIRMHIQKSVTSMITSKLQLAIPALHSQIAKLRTSQSTKTASENLYSVFNDPNFV